MIVPSLSIQRWLSCAALAVGTLMFAGACSEPAPPPEPAAPAVKSAEVRAQWYQDCWNHFNSKAWTEFEACYAENAVSESVDSDAPSATGRAAIIERAKMEATAFPDRRGELRLLLVNGDRMASVALYSATNTGPMPPGPDGKPMPATGKPVGLLMAHTVDLDPTGSHAVRDASYVDDGTMAAQLGMNPAPARPAEKPSGALPTIVIARNDDAERANLASAQAIFDAVNKHDLKAIEALTPEDYKLIEVARPTDVGKKESLAGAKEMFGAFPDVKVTPVTMWAARDYVAIAGTFEGTNTGDLPSMGLKKTGRKVSARFFEIIRFENGQPKEDWLFYNGAAMAAQLGVK
jgi:predicted ester cyclase